MPGLPFSSTWYQSSSSLSAAFFATMINRYLPGLLFHLYGALHNSHHYQERTKHTLREGAKALTSSFEMGKTDDPS